MSKKYGISDTEYKIILTQMERRKKFRKEYLKQRTNPYLHAQESGNVNKELQLKSKSFTVGVVGVSSVHVQYIIFHIKPTIGLADIKFDEAHQRYIAMQASQLERFAPTRRNIVFGICAIIVPMVSYGILITSDRNKREQKIRSGDIRYRDRLFKLC